MLGGWFCGVDKLRCFCHLCSVHPDVSGVVAGRIERNLLVTEVTFGDAQCGRKHG